MELNLPGLVEEPNGDAVDITWKQVEGPAAIIAGAGIEEAILVAPEVTEDTLIVLELTATDSQSLFLLQQQIQKVMTLHLPSMTSQAQV